MRVIGNRLAPLNRRMVARISVPGRRSGQWRTTPIVVLEHEGNSYLVSAFGHSDWTRNLRASRRGRLAAQGRVRDFVAVEVPVAERGPLLDAYLRRYGKMPRVAATFAELPDPADHPTFRIQPA